jgi:hypothetical protein
LVNKEIKNIYNSSLDDVDDGICEGPISNQSTKLDRHRMRVIDDSDDDSDGGGGFITEDSNIIPNHINEINNSIISNNNNQTNITANDYTKWICSDCTYGNSSNLDHCELCNHTRDERVKSDTWYNQQLKNKSSSSNNNRSSSNISINDSLWVCKACTYAQNIYSRENCEVCDNKRDQLIGKNDNKYNKKENKKLTFQEAQEAFLIEKNNDIISTINDDNNNTATLINNDDSVKLMPNMNKLSSIRPSTSPVTINESNSTKISEPVEQVVSNFMKDAEDDIEWESEEDDDYQGLDNNNAINDVNDDKSNDFFSKVGNNLIVNNNSLITKEFLEEKDDINDNYNYNTNSDIYDANQSYSSSSSSSYLSNNNTGINKDTYQRAITMACNMTDWAGRAVQKVLKEHMTHQSVSNQATSLQLPSSQITSQQFEPQLVENHQLTSQSSSSHSLTSSIPISSLDKTSKNELTIESLSSSFPLPQEVSNESSPAPSLIQSSMSPPILAMSASSSKDVITEVPLSVPIVNTIQQSSVHNSSLINPISLLSEDISPLFEQQATMPSVSTSIESSSSSISNDLSINMSNSSPMINFKKRLPSTITNDFEEYQNKKNKIQKSNEILDKDVINEKQIIQDKEYNKMLIEEEENETKIRRVYNHSMRDAESLTREMRDEVIELLNIFNLPYIVAPFEAEAQCAVLEQLGLVDGVVTEDSGN